MNIGTRVMPKSLGVPVIGTVVSIINLEFYFSTLDKNDNFLSQMMGPTGYQQYRQLKLKYPECENLITVLYDQPIRQSPLSHFKGSNKAFAKVSFLTQPAINYGIYPDTDLEVVSNETFQKALEIEAEKCGLESVEEEQDTQGPF